MLVRLSPGTIVTRVAANARANAYSRVRARIRGSSGTSDSATPPVITTTSGFSPFTTAPPPAAPARGPVELRRGGTRPAAEPRRAAHEPAVQHDPGAEAGAEREDD